LLGQSSTSMCRILFVSFQKLVLTGLKQIEMLYNRDNTDLDPDS